MIIMIFIEKNETTNTSNAKNKGRIIQKAAYLDIRYWNVTECVNETNMFFLKRFRELRACAEEFLGSWHEL